MLTKGLILNIDYNDHYCNVRIPLFETAGNLQIVSVKATICTTPGIYNGYKEGDIVFVAFEDNELNEPVIIGKLYTDANTEKNASSAISCNTLYAKNLTLPLTTKIESDNTLKNLIDGGGMSYPDIGAIIDQLQALSAKVAELEERLSNQ